MAIINKTGITNGGTIQAEHVTRAIDALSGGSTDTVVATGSFSGSFTGTLTGTITSASYAPNFANTDLTFTGNRLHNTNGNAFEITTDNGAYQQGFVYLDTTKGEFGRGVNYASYGTTTVTHYQSGSRKIDLSNTETVFNETGLDVDFRVESDTNANMLTVDAGTNRIGIGKASPNAVLDINGNTIVTGSLQLTGDLSLVKTDFKYLGALTTTNNTTALLANISLSSYNIANIQVDISGQTTSGPLSGSFTSLMASFLYTGSAAVQLGTTTTIHHVSTIGASAPTIDASGGNARVRVTGITGTNVSWYATYQITYA